MAAGGCNACASHTENHRRRHLSSSSSSLTKACKKTAHAEHCDCALLTLLLLYLCKAVNATTTTKEDSSRGQKLIDTLRWLIYRIAPHRCHCNIFSLKPGRVWLVRGLCSLWTENGPALVHTAVVGVGLKVLSQSSRFQLVYVRGNLEQAEAQIKYSRWSYQTCVAFFSGRT